MEFFSCFVVSGEENDKDSAQSMEETENIPPKASQSTTKKRRKLFQKPSAVAALSSPATVTVSYLFFMRPNYFAVQALKILGSNLVFLSREVTP